MKRLTDDIKRAWAALRHADADDYMSLRSRTHYLQSQASAATASPPRRSIAIIASEHLDLSVVQYAVSACVRMEAELLVLCSRDAGEVGPRSVHFEGMLETAEVQCRQVFVEGSIAEYLRQQTRILFVVAAAEEDNQALLVPKKGRTPVPVVLVSGKSVEHDAGASHSTMPCHPV